MLELNWQHLQSHVVSWFQHLLLRWHSQSLLNEWALFLCPNGHTPTKNSIKNSWLPTFYFLPSGTGDNFMLGVGTESAAAKKPHHVLVPTPFAPFCLAVFEWSPYEKIFIQKIVTMGDMWCHYLQTPMIQVQYHYHCKHAIMNYPTPKIQWKISAQCFVSDKPELPNSKPAKIARSRRKISGYGILSVIPYSWKSRFKKK